jgi:hypothetical protein
MIIKPATASSGLACAGWNFTMTAETAPKTITIKPSGPMIVILFAFHFAHRRHTIGRGRARAMLFFRLRNLKKALQLLGGQRRFQKLQLD